MYLAGLMRDPWENLSHSGLESLLVITDQATNPIAQTFDGLEDALRQDFVIGSQQGNNL